jgi:hypothetical protein
MTRRKVDDEDSETDEELEASLAEHEAKMRYWRSLSHEEQVAQLNESYADYELDEEDRAWLEFGRRQMAKRLADDEW